MKFTLIPRSGKIPTQDTKTSTLPPVTELDGSEACGVILPTIWLDLTDEQRDRFLDNTRCTLRLLGFKQNPQTDYTEQEREFWLSGIACVEVSEYIAEIYHPISQKDVEVSIDWNEIVYADNITIYDRIDNQIIEQLNDWARFDPAIYIID